MGWACCACGRSGLEKIQAVEVFWDLCVLAHVSSWCGFFYSFFYSLPNSVALTCALCASSNACTCIGRGGRAHGRRRERQRICTAARKRPRGARGSGRQWRGTSASATATASAAAPTVGARGRTRRWRRSKGQPWPDNLAGPVWAHFDGRARAARAARIRRCVLGRCAQRAFQGRQAASCARRNGRRRRRRPRQAQEAARRRKRLRRLGECRRRG